MKMVILQLSALASALAFGAVAPVTPRVATNIAESVVTRELRSATNQFTTASSVTNTVTNVVTKAYVEGLGIDSGVAKTNVINNVIRNSTHVTLVNSDGGNIKSIVTIGPANVQYNLAGMMSADDKRALDGYGPKFAGVTNAVDAATNRVNELGSTVGTWDSFLNGSNVVFSITNYQSGTYHTGYGKLKILELREGEYVEIYDSHKDITTHVTNETEATKTQLREEMGASNSVVFAALENKADREWGKYTSSGNSAPESGTVYMTAPHTVFGGGYEFERVNVNEGAIWVLTDKGAPVYTDGEEGVFKFQDLGGTNYFGFAKSDSYMIGCDTDAIAVRSGVVTLTYNLTGAIPIVYYKQTLTGEGDWEALNDASGNPVSGASVLVQWDESPPEGQQLAHISCGNSPSGFFFARIVMVGGSKFFTNMEADFQGGITCTNTALGVTGVIVPVYDGSTVNWQWRSR